MEFEPKILGFMCNWCCYAAADGAGVARQIYPPYHRVVRTMCSTRVDPLLVFTGFQSGADAIFVGGCHLGECKYGDGNYLAVVMAEVVKTIMSLIGLNPERFMLEWASAAEGNKLVEDLKKFFQKIKNLGPLGKEANWTEEDKSFYLNSCLELSKSLIFRMGYAKLCRDLKKLGNFSIINIKTLINKNLLPVIKNKLYEIQIKKLIQNNLQDLDYLAKKINITPEEIQKILKKVQKN